MTAAPGDELEKVMPLEAKAMAKVKADLEAFSDAMYSKRLFHGDLTPANVLWDGKDATVIDFGNGQDLNEEATTRRAFVARRRFVDARNEMDMFFRHRLGLE